MTTQAEFRAALLDPGLPVPPGLTAPGGRPAGRRFDVYRNNVVVSLSNALAEGFPVLVKLLGEDFFKALAREFLRAHPPASPLLMLYGESLPGFLATFPPVAGYPYLPDIARLELALRQSYHAADSRAVEPAALAALPPDRLLDTRLDIAPAVRVLASPWPILSIWRANTEADAPAPVMGPEDVLVGRPGFDPAPWLLPPGGVAFASALAMGAPLGAALEGAGDAFDLAATLEVLLAAGAITGLR